jgi:hypothetical protein
MDVALHAKCQRELSHVVAVGRFDHDNKVRIARSQLDLFDLNANFLREIACRLRTLGGVFDSADSLICKVK